MEKRPLAPLVVFIVIVALGCSLHSASGKYVSEKNPENYLELKRDGTFYAEEDGLWFQGKYDIERDQIRLKVEGGRLGGKVLRGRIQGSKITDPEGEVWVKQ